MDTRTRDITQCRMLACQVQRPQVKSLLLPTIAKKEKKAMFLMPQLKIRECLKEKLKTFFSSCINRCAF